MNQEPEDKPQQFIVAEISKTWTLNSPATNLVSNQFEQVINFNLKRNYRLLNWQFHTTNRNNSVIETIIAVFEYSQKT